MKLRNSLTELFVPIILKGRKKYQFPPIQLLKPKLNSDDSDAMEEMQNNAKSLLIPSQALV